MIPLFDTALLRARRDRAASRAGDFDFLFAEVAERLMERLSLIKRDFPNILEIGAANGVMTRQLKARAGTQNVIAMDTSAAMNPDVVGEAEFLPLRSGSLDAVVSNMALHWVNDLPGALAQISRALKPDGLFLSALAGGETLFELRQCLMEAELAVTGGVSPRVSPFIDPRDMGGLMQRAGFALPVVDSDMIPVHYDNALRLMRDLRGMGAANATFNRLKTPTRRAVLFEAARLYQEKFAGADGKIPATFHIVYAIGWTPHASQPQPLKRGTATHKLAEVLT